MPSTAWVGVALGWTRTLALAVAYVLVGASVDAVIHGRGLGPLLIGVAACAAVAMVSGGTAEALPAHLQAGEESRWRSRIVRSLLSPGRDGMDGADVSLATDGVERIAAYRATFLGPTLAAFTSPGLVLAVVAVAVDPVVAAGAAVLVAVVPSFVAAATRRFRRPSVEFRRLAAGASGRFLEVLRNLGMLRLLGAERRGREIVSGAADELRARIVQMQRRSQLTILANDALFSIALITATVSIAFMRMAHGALAPGAVAATILLATLLCEPLDRLGRTFYVGMGGRGQQDEALRMIGAHAADSPSEGPAVDARRPPTIALRSVSASLGGAEVLHGVDAHIAAGGTLAVFGPSGAGKSTLGAVLQGLLEPSSGRVLLDGREASSAELLRRCRTVPQTPFLFTGTIAENLRLARADASDTDLWRALRFAWLAHEVRAMPDGLGTQVGEAGAALSGGQAGRLAIARAVLSGAGMIVLDEPTADLDRHTEALVTESIRELTGLHTVVLIAHRLETTRSANAVLVMEEGSAIALGTPDELLAEHGYYATASAKEKGR